ncbi:hypothetical protein L3Q72_08895 [Vibrio sp. JC009]|uniref:hypothetical protein n=1 Tax=Vibrio sp. JC009 TaxID=2912314 RepID=UPI0023B025F7|nr:hypothetical protein [Vibrio sp. JC009]WED20760.1 hypothetical protein L3Q72_08895 [Vibrio sp. JC009]
MSARRKVSVLFLSFSIAYSPLTAAEAEISEAADTSYSPEILLAEPESWVDLTETYISDTVHDFSSFLDHHLAKDENEEIITNRSYVKIDATSVYTHRDDYSSDGRIKARIHLPHIRKNWKLLLETEPDDYESLESKERDTAAKTANDSVDGAIAGVDLPQEQYKFWTSDLDIGIKIKLPFDPFIRGEIRRVEELSENWTGQFKQRVFHFHSIGSGTLSELSFYYAVNEDESDIITATSSAQYLHEDHSWELLQQFVYSDRLNDRHLLEHAIGLSANPDEDEKITNYWISTSWRQKLYKDWLYLYVTPEIEFPRTYDYKINPGVMLQVEAYFTKKRDINRLNRSIPKSTRRLN